MPKVCSVGKHKDRKIIDRRLAKQEPYRDISGQTGLSKSAFERHLNTCIGTALTNLKTAKNIIEVEKADAFLQPRTTTSTGSGSQTQTQPGTPWQSFLGGGLGDLSTLLYLNQIHGGGKGGSGGGIPWNAIQGAIGSLPYPCHIAGELYGAKDWRVTLLRLWLSMKAKESLRWRGFVLVYQVFGKTVAETIQSDKQMRAYFKRMFDGFVRQALKA